MRSQFYHAIVLGALLVPACSRPAPEAAVPATPPPPSATSASAPQPSTSAQSTPAATSAQAPSAAATPTADGVRLGKDIIERIRAAAGGPKLTALRSFEAIGTSTLSVGSGARALSVRALYPGFYRQEEIPQTRGGLGVAIGVGSGGMGWMLGARLGGAARADDATSVQAAYNRAGSQAMAGFLAGVNAPWLVDSGQFVAIAGSAMNGGDDANLVIVNLEGPFGRAGRLVVDPATHLPRRFVQPPQAGTMGEAGRSELNFAYTDYRDVNGVQLPHTIVRRVGNIQTTWAITKYTLNPRLSPRLFSRAFAAKNK